MILRTNERMVGGVMIICNPLSREAKTGGSLGPADQQLSLVDELQAREILSQAVSGLPEEDARMCPWTSVCVSMQLNAHLHVNVHTHMETFSSDT